MRTRGGAGERRAQAEARRAAAKARFSTVGFIFTIHFFNTHLRPEKFPMDIVVFTGRMPVEELKRDKPAEYEAVMKAGTLEENLGEAYQPIVLKAIRVFGWTALSLGFLTVLWIIYAMLFSYK